MRILFNITICVGLYLSCVQASHAAPRYYSTVTGQEILGQEETLFNIQSGGVIVTLPEGEKLTQGDFEITAKTNSEIYFSSNGNVLSSAVLDGIVENTQNAKISSGEVFIFDTVNKEIEKHDFDTKHFLEQTNYSPAPETLSKLEKISDAQSLKKSLGLLEEGASATPTKENLVSTIITGLREQNISDVNINNERMNLQQFEALALSGGLPLHLLITWGAGLRDVDLHLTGPNGDERFHVFYLNTGDLENDPKAALIDDCISTNCSEVITIQELKNGGVYKASVFNAAKGANANNDLSTSDIQIELIRGGVAVEFEGDTDLGTQISGGESLFKASPTSSDIGNTWQALEIDADKNEINLIDNITSFAKARDVD